MDSFDHAVKKASEFHGHLGPFLVIGVRMGRMALERLDTRGFKELKAMVDTGQKPPISCIVDGIQMSTGCTSGKGNISISEKGKPSAAFISGEKRMTITLREEIKERIFHWFNEEPGEDTARRIMQMSDEELFLIE